MIRIPEIIREAVATEGSGEELEALVCGVGMEGDSEFRSVIKYALSAVRRGFREASNAIEAANIAKSVLLPSMPNFSLASDGLPRRADDLFYKGSLLEGAKVEHLLNMCRQKTPDFRFAASGHDDLTYWGQVSEPDCESPDKDSGLPLGSGLLFSAGTWAVLNRGEGGSSVLLGDFNEHGSFGSLSGARGAFGRHVAGIDQRTFCSKNCHTVYRSFTAGVDTVGPHFRETAGILTEGILSSDESTFGFQVGVRRNEESFGQSFSGLTLYSDFKRLLLGSLKDDRPRGVWFDSRGRLLKHPAN